MDTLGAVLKRAHNDPDDEDQVNEAWAEALTDHKRRATALKDLRQLLPETKDVPDEELFEDALRRTGKRAWALPSDPQRSKSVQRSMATVSGVDRYVDQRVASQKIQKGQGETEYSREQARRHDVQTLTPHDVKTGVVARQFETQEEMDQEARDKGLKVVNAGNVMFPTLQLQDDNGNTLGQLNPSATRSQSGPDIGNVTGQTSIMQKMGTQALERIYDPRTGEWFKDTEGRTPLFSFGFDPEKAKAMQKGFEDTAKSSRGLREYGGEVGAQIGKAAPRLTAGVSRALSVPLAGGAMALGAVDSAEEAILNGMAALPSYSGTGNEGGVLSNYAAEQAAEAERYERAGEQLWSAARDGFPATPEAGGELGRGLGYTGGEVASLVAPTEGGPVAGVAIGGAAKLAGKGVKAVGRQVAKKLPEEFDTLAGIFSSQPSALVLPDVERSIARGIQSEARNAADMVEIQFHQRGMDALRQALPGRTDEELKVVLDRAKRAWDSPAKRMALDPDAALAVTTLQPLHEDAFRTLFGADKPYNPLHVHRGQNLTKRARQIETRTAEEAARDADMSASESLADVGSPSTAASQIVAGARGGKVVPGIDPQRAMSGTAATDYVPRIGRSWESQAQQLRKIGQEDAADEVEHLDLLSGMAKTYRLGRESQGVRSTTAWDAFKRELPKIHSVQADKYFKEQDLSKVLDQYRTAKGAKISPEMEAQLIKDDNVLLTSSPLSGRNVFHVDDAELSGKVVSKRMAMAIREASSESEGLRKAQQVAHVMDSVLGTTQWKNIVTRGNPGFNWRQRMNEAWRVATDNPDALSRKNLALVEEISNAPVGNGGRFIPELGMTAGEAHEQVLKFGSLSKGFTEDLRAASRETPGPVWLPKAVSKGFNKSVDAVESTAGEAANQAYRKLFPQLNKRYDTEAGMRMASMLGHMRNGVSPMAAAMRMKNTMLDFSDPSILTTVGGQVIPFLNYQIGASRSVGNLVLRNPRRYARVYDMMRISENLDTALNNGDPINQKMKLDKDRLAGTPYVREGKQTISAMRPETLGSEVASLSGLLTGETPGISLMHPSIQGGGAAFTGQSSNTGRSIYNLPKDWQEKLDSSVPPGPMHAWDVGQEAMRQGLITPVEFYTAIAAQTPGVSRVMDFPPAGLAARQFTHTANPASRTDDAGVEQLRRSLRSFGTGIRSQTVDPMMIQAQQERKKIPKTYLETWLERAMKGQQ